MNSTVAPSSPPSTQDIEDIHFRLVQAVELIEVLAEAADGPECHGRMRSALQIAEKHMQTVVDDLQAWIDEPGKSENELDLHAQALKHVGAEVSR